MVADIHKLIANVKEMIIESAKIYILYVIDTRIFIVIFYLYFIAATHYCDYCQYCIRMLY